MDRISNLLRNAAPSIQSPDEMAKAISSTEEGYKVTLITLGKTMAATNYTEENITMQWLRCEYLQNYNKEAQIA